MKISVSLDYEQYINLCVDTNKDNTSRMEGAPSVGEPELTPRGGHQDGYLSNP